MQADRIIEISDAVITQTRFVEKLGINRCRKAAENIQNEYFSVRIVPYKRRILHTIPPHFR
jgi:hypothetical protein